MAGDNDRAADHLMDALLWSNQSAWIEHHLVSARPQLGEEEFVVAYAEGQRMTLDEAVNYALEEVSRFSPTFKGQ